MKKNLRIVSAAAAALLAIAPVAASSFVAPATTVSAADATNSDSNYSQINLNGNVTAQNRVTNVNPSIVLSSANGNIAGNLTGSISATFNGTTATGNLPKGQNGKAAVKITANDAYKINNTDVAAGAVLYNGIEGDSATAIPEGLKALAAGQKFTVELKGLGFNFGANNAGKTVTLALPKDSAFSFEKTANVQYVEGENDQKAVQVQLDNNGTITGLALKGVLTAFDAANTNGVSFYNVANGALANSGEVTLVANANSQLNTAALISAVESNYVAVQKNLASNNDTSNGGRGDDVTLNTVANKGLKVSTTEEDIVKDLKAQGIDVDANGNFTAKHSFTFNYNVVSNVNGKTGKLPVTVTVANVAEPTVASVSKRIMHNAYYYDKDAKRVGTDKLTRYNSVTVSPKTTTIKGKAYYEVVENGKLSGKYINADNIDGTKRTLKHNAYVYASSKKRANKVVLKKGDTVTTYGASYTFKNGKQYYKIGNDTAKTYVKASNF